MHDVPNYLRADAVKIPMDWSEGGKVHNWRNHVGDYVRSIWDTFNKAQKIAIAADADDLAGNEHWE